jgi:hypothetical protein
MLAGFRKICDWQIAVIKPCPFERFWLGPYKLAIRPNSTLTPFWCANAPSNSSFFSFCKPYVERGAISERSVIGSDEAPAYTPPAEDE